MSISDFSDFLGVQGAYASRGHSPEGQFWLDVAQGEVFELSGIAAGGESEAEHRWNVDFSQEDFSVVIHVLVPDRLGSARVYHLARVYFLDSNYQDFLGRRDISVADWNITIPVTVSDGKLFFAGQE